MANENRIEGEITVFGVEFFNTIFINPDILARIKKRNLHRTGHLGAFNLFIIQREIPQEVH